jgi:hypothetical protein
MVVQPEVSLYIDLARCIHFIEVRIYFTDKHYMHVQIICVNNNVLNTVHKVPRLI